MFNRWGALIYQSDNYQNNWNGTSNKHTFGVSKQVPSGTYFYIIKLINSGLKSISGTIYMGTK